MPLPIKENVAASLGDSIATGYARGQQIALERKRLAQEEKTQSSLNEWRSRQYELEKQRMMQEQTIAQTREQGETERYLGGQKAENERLGQSLQSARELATIRETGEESRFEREQTGETERVRAREEGENVRLDKTLKSAMDVAITNAGAQMDKDQQGNIKDILNNFNTNAKEILTAPIGTFGGPADQETALRYLEKRTAIGLIQAGAQPEIASSILSGYENIRPNIVTRTRREIFGIPIPGTTSYGVEPLPEVADAIERYKNKELSSKSFANSIKRAVEAGQLDVKAGVDLIEKLIPKSEWDRTMGGR